MVNETINSKYIVFNKNLNLNKALFYKNNKKFWKLMENLVFLFNIWILSIIMFRI